ncbi:MAG: sigma-54-dependent Fis family transcriptional regulator, partial [Calditrichia bacterium]|nr:sigma-54-dependent Fis family transcriptional regulator [Calditrichia bacterium]
MPIKNKKPTIITIDDEEMIRKSFRHYLEDYNFDIIEADNGKTGLEIIYKTNPDLVLLDLRMPEMDGMTALKEIRKINKTVPVLIMTAYGTIESAVEAVKNGAYDYLTKPVTPDRLRTIIPKAIEHNKLVISHHNLQEKLKHLTHYEDLIGESPQMLEIYRLIDAVADSTANVIITGESGTGKELVARAIHNKSGRRKGSFIGVNCASFPKDILENELFGHEKGAFTGALDEKHGCFELANNGTLFLDEIGEMAIETQPKILRALEERKFRRLGGKKEINVDVRIVAATNRDLKQAITQNLIREDLYYRLCVVEVELPPLRERISDIPLLFYEFINLYNKTNNKNIIGITTQCEEVLMRYQWPGNVRELKNVIERAVV